MPAAFRRGCTDAITVQQFETWIVLLAKHLNKHSLLSKAVAIAKSIVEVNNFETEDELASLAVADLQLCGVSVGNARALGCYLGGCSVTPRASASHDISAELPATHCVSQPSTPSTPSGLPALSLPTLDLVKASEKAKDLLERLKTPRKASQPSPETPRRALSSSKAAITKRALAPATARRNSIQYSIETHAGMSDEHTARVEAVFDQIDCDGSGVIDLEVSIVPGTYLVDSCARVQTCLWC